MQMTNKHMKDAHHHYQQRNAKQNMGRFCWEKKKKKKDNTHPASKLAFGAKFQVTGDVRGGEQEPRDWGAGGR